jgi:hypothetical protein
MTQRLTNSRNLITGLLLGVVATLALGQAAAPRPAPNAAAAAPRYQIAVTRDRDNNEYLLILDHQTQKVYRRFTGNMNDAAAVEQLIANR